MDLIKETYDLLNYHLGVEHRGSKRLGPEYEELKKDIQALVIHALEIGEVSGVDTIKFMVKEDHYKLMNTISTRLTELLRAVTKSQYKSRSIKPG